MTEIVERFSYINKQSDLDLYEVVNTVDKIIANSSEEIVKREDVSSQLDEILNLNIFNLTDAISKKNSLEASKVYLQILRSNEDPFMIYHMIIRQVRNLIGVKSLYINGFNDSFIMKNIGIGSFELKKLKSFSKNFSLNELFDIHSRLFDMEYRQKSSDFNMEMEILLLINMITNNILKK